MEIVMKIPPNLKNLFVAIAMNFHGNKDENPAQLKKKKNMKIMETWNNFME
jgi:hypothetical protein